MANRVVLGKLPDQSLSQIRKHQSIYGDHWGKEITLNRAYEIKRAKILLSYDVKI